MGPSEGLPFRIAQRARGAAGRVRESEMTARVLIIDDDDDYASALARHLTRAGHEVVKQGDASSARAHAVALSPEVVVLDQCLPDTEGLTLLDELKTQLRTAVFVVMTAYPDVDFAVEAMRHGAFDYFEKGQDARESTLRIERAVDHAQLKRRVVEAQAEQGVRARAGLIGDSPAMERLRARLDALAASNDTMALITGETGVGKGLVARAIHLASGRAGEPFVAVDCTTIPNTLVESELFGHEKGAFSGASGVRAGRVESAQRGTLFLDEIGELELPIQAKLLRLLEEREYTRVGSNTVRRLGARIISATNRDLTRAVEEGRFRADLRFRLEVFVLEVPPLREREDDVFLVAEHYIAERSRALGRHPPALSATVRETMRRYPFPGNVRELKNMVEQALLLADRDELGIDEFPVLAKFRAGWQPPVSNGRASVRPSALTASFPLVAIPPASRVPEIVPRLDDASLSRIRERHNEHERSRMLSALSDVGGNVSHAARNLGLSRYQLLRRLSKHGLR
jgi:two-component system response regulator AtoC